MCGFPFQPRAREPPSFLTVSSSFVAVSFAIAGRNRLTADRNRKRRRKCQRYPDSYQLHSLDRLCCADLIVWSLHVDIVVLLLFALFCFESRYTSYKSTRSIAMQLDTTICARTTHTVVQCTLDGPKKSEHPLIVHPMCNGPVVGFSLPRINANTTH